YITASLLFFVFFFLCSRLKIYYALPRKSTEVMLMQEQGTKTYVDAVLKTHHRVVQVRPGLLSVACSSFIFSHIIIFTTNPLLSLCTSQHTEADFQARFKARPELEGLIAQMNQ
uniref:Uncharacterized protein n=1 Tax=Astatotilapia calliptera TaxID=8154 RepID=A0A3P8R455_ASTCA